LKIYKKKFGFDLDNTLINYTYAAQIYGSLNNLKTCKDIVSLRSLLNSNDVTGRKWQQAQSWMYTEGLSFAYPNSGAKELCSYLIANNYELQIVSHKTTHTPDFCGKKSLRNLATKWIKDSELSGYFLNDKMIHYESTRIKKVKKIKSLNLDYFVDDLKEVFLEPEYPKEIVSFLISGNEINIPWVQTIPSLLEIREVIDYGY